MNKFLRERGTDRFMNLIYVHKIGPYLTKVRSTGLALFTLASLLAAGCAVVGPEYVAVDPQSPDTWQSELQGGLTPGAATNLAHWWVVLQDPQLSALEERAVSGSLELKEAQARIREARALRGLSRSGYFPDLDAEAAANRSKSSANSASGSQRDLYSAGFDASWELDLFGGVKRSVQAAQASLEAVEANRYDLQVSLMAEVALNYVELRSYQARLAISADVIKSLQESFELNDSRFQAGLIGELAVQQSLRLLESAKAQLPALETGLNAAQNRLALLLGVAPGSLHGELAAPRPLPGLPISLAVGIPAETLRRRPDIRRAERNLAAQTARIGVATADLYPKLRLAGTFGLEALAAGDLFQAASKSWKIGPSLSWKLFDAGAVRRNIEIQNARQEQALLQYERNILRAREEVENALVAYAKEQLRRDSLTSAVKAAERSEVIARDQYQAGLVDFSNVLDAQRSLLLLQDEQIRSEANIIANLVRLYKALGGGWDSAATERVLQER